MTFAHLLAATAPLPVELQSTVSGVAARAVHTTTRQHGSTPCEKHQRVAPLPSRSCTSLPPTLHAADAVRGHCGEPSPRPRPRAQRCPARRRRRCGRAWRWTASTRTCPPARALVLVYLSQKLLAEGIFTHCDVQRARFHASKGDKRRAKKPSRRTRAHSSIATAWSRGGRVSSTPARVKVVQLLWCRNCPCRRRRGGRRRRTETGERSLGAAGRVKEASKAYPLLIDYCQASHAGHNEHLANFIRIARNLPKAFSSSFT